MKIKALVLGVGGNVSQGIVKALRSVNMEITVIGACISKESIGLYVCDKAYVSPYANDSSFIDWYITTCNTEKIDIAFTGVEEIIDTLLKNRNYIDNSCSTKFIYPNKLSWDVGGDKYLTCDWLMKNGCNYPKFAASNNKLEVEKFLKDMSYPFIAKPRSGKGSKGVFIIHNENELKPILSYDNYVLEECIGTKEQEYTVGCYCDKNSKLMGVIIMRRTLKNGTTSMCEIVNNKFIEKEVRSIVDKIKPIGPINFQMRLANDRAVCFEINVRYSGTTAIRNHFGFKDIEAGIKEYLLGQDINDCFNYTFGSAMRLDDEIYFDKSLTDLFNGVK